MNSDGSGEIALSDIELEALLLKEKLDNLNKQTMSAVVDEYRWSYELLPYEIAAIDSVPDIRDKPILDMGVGTGRTTNGLLEISKDYLGIDYAREMLDSCEQHFPHVRFELADARDMSAYADESFYTAFFSSNGICMVNHDDRMKILKEVYRLLKPGGVFLFSAYNQHFLKNMKAFYFPDFGMTLNPVKFIVRGMRFCRSLILSLVNRWRYKHLEVKTEEYEIINDRCHNYATMLYYTTPQNMEKQLHESGFTAGLTAYAINGKPITDDNVTDDTLFYVIRK